MNALMRLRQVERSNKSEEHENKNDSIFPIFQNTLVRNLLIRLTQVLLCDEKILEMRVCALVLRGRIAKGKHSKDHFLKRPDTSMIEWLAPRVRYDDEIEVKRRLIVLGEVKKEISEKKAGESIGKELFGHDSIDGPENLITSQRKPFKSDEEIWAVQQTVFCIGMLKKLAKNEV